MTKQSIVLIFFIGSVLINSSCTQKKEDNNDEVAAPAPKEYTEVLQDITEQEAIDFVETWKNIYTTHTFDNYIKMYDPVNFVGIKRTYQGEKNTYDFSGWVTNKKNEFRKYQPEVMVEKVKVKQLNYNGRTKVSFIQTWVSYKGQYADEGEKVLVLKKIDGEIRIEKEELLYSKPLYDYFMGC